MEPPPVQPKEFIAPHRDLAARQSFHNARTSMGAAAHWVKMAGIMAPLLIGEVVKDAEKKWRWIRISSVATALLAEGLYTRRIHRERQQRHEERER
jgi:bacteriorhodopsin